MFNPVVFVVCSFISAFVFDGPLLIIDEDEVEVVVPGTEEEDGVEDMEQERERDGNKDRPNLGTRDEVKSRMGYLGSGDVGNKGGEIKSKDLVPDDDQMWGKDVVKSKGIDLLGDLGICKV